MSGVGINDGIFAARIKSHCRQKSVYFTAGCGPPRNGITGDSAALVFVEGLWRASPSPRVAEDVSVSATL